MLRPGRMLVTSSGVWVLDVFQPVAAVLDPDTGALRRLVSWAQVPPPPPDEDVVVCADGEALWIQHGRRGPLVRVDLDGVSTTVWVEGLGLAAAGEGRAWCTSPSPGQELVRGVGSEPDDLNGFGQLARVDRAGRVETVCTDAPVRALSTSKESLWAQLDVHPWSSRSLGGDTAEVVWSSRWVALPWVGALPDRVTASAGQGDRPDATWVHPVGEGVWLGHRYDPSAPPGGRGTVAADGMLWRIGLDPSPSTRPRPGGRVIAAAFATGAEAGAGPVRVVELGGTGIRAAAASGERLVMVVGGATPSLEPAPFEDLTPGVRSSAVVAVNPDSRPAQVWLRGGQIDITEHCRPLRPRPLDADSYLQRVLSRWSRMERHEASGEGWHPLTRGVSRSRARLVGDWPATQLEFTFEHTSRPGVRLRRRIPLFDELGAIADPEFADVGLMEDLDTGRVPPPADARDGFLDL